MDEDGLSCKAKLMSYEVGGVLRRLTDPVISLAKLLCVALVGDLAFNRKLALGSTLRFCRLHKNVFCDLFFPVYVVYAYFPEP